MMETSTRIHSARAAAIACMFALSALAHGVEGQPAASVATVPAAPTPAADHHQYLFSPAAAAWLSSSMALAPVGADELVARLDAAGVGRAAVLSVAYSYGGPARAVDSALGVEYARVRAENDWVAAQAARHPQRLVALCSFNPLRDYALLELGRCATSPGFGRGIKLDLGDSGVRLDRPDHVARLRDVFRAANARGMAIVVDMRATRGAGRPYGAEQARVLLEQVLPCAPDVPVQVAHLAGINPGDAPDLGALAVLADAAARRDPRMRQVWFDVASVVRAELAAADARRLVRRLRQAGLERVLYGSDAAFGGAAHGADHWAAFRRLPLTEAEAARVARNLAPYLQEAALR